MYKRQVGETAVDTGQALERVGETEVDTGQALEPVDETEVDSPRILDLVEETELDSGITESDSAIILVSAEASKVDDLPRF